MIFRISILLIAIGLSIGEDLSNSTIQPKRSPTCCSAQRPCQTIYWPVSMEKGFHRPITDRFGQSISSLFRSRFDFSDDDCHSAAAKTSRGEIRYRLPSIIANLTAADSDLGQQQGNQKRDKGNRKKKNNGRINVLTFASSLDYYRFLLRKLAPIDNPIDIDLAFIDFYSDHDDLADLLSRIVETDSAWFRVEIELVTARYNLSIGDQSIIGDQRKSILNNRFVAEFNRKFTFLLNEPEASIRELWYEMFAEFGTHYHDDGRLGGVYAFYGKIDCDSWANAFDTLDDFGRCIQYLIRSDDTSNMTSQQSDLCRNVTNRSPIRGRVEIAGGSDLEKGRLLSESHFLPTFDLLWRDWAKTIRDRPSLIAAASKPVCHLIRHIFEIDFEKNAAADIASKKIDTYFDSCMSALSSYSASSQPFTGGVILDDKNSAEAFSDREPSDKPRPFSFQFKNQCTPRQQNSRLSIPVVDDKESRMIVVSVRYDNNDSVCVAMRSWSEDEKKKFLLCSLLKSDESVVAAALAGSAVGNMSALNLGVIIIVVTTGTILPIFGVLRTLPAF